MASPVFGKISAGDRWRGIHFDGTLLEVKRVYSVLVCSFHVKTKTPRSYLVVNLKTTRNGDRWVTTCADLPGIGGWAYPSKEESLERTIESILTFLNRLEVSGQTPTVLKRHGLSLDPTRPEGFIP